MIFLICICLWVMVQSPRLARALRAKAEADHRLRLSQIELMRAIEKHLFTTSHTPRWNPGKN